MVVPLPYLGHLGRVAVLLALMALYTALAGSSLIHLDLARDMRIAADIRDGIRYPLLGPMLAGRIQLGSGWYYLLAALQQIGGGWLGATTLLALLSSLQFPLAYLAGKAWSGRPAGLLWACLLIMPSWSMFEQVSPTHTQLIGAAATAVMLGALRYYRTGKRKYLLAMAFAYSLALHAHPTALVLLGIPIAALVHGWLRRQIDLPTLALVGLVAAIPFAPLLIDQLLNGFTLFGKVGGYLVSDNIEHVSLGNYLPLLWQLTGGGLRYWLAGMLGLPIKVSWFAAIAAAGVMAVGVVGAIRLAIAKDRVTRLALLLLPLSLLMLVFMRGFFPYWMITALRVGLLGVVAVGLSQLVPARLRLGFGAIVGPICVGSYLLVASSVFRWERGGTWPFAFLPGFDIKNVWQAHRPLAIMPARGMARSGRWLCASGPVAIHGPYALNLLHDYAQEARLACTTHDIAIGGNKPGRQHWIGLSRDMLKALGRGGQVDFGVFGLLPVSRVPGTPTALADPTHGGFPPVAANSGPEQTLNVPAALADHEYLALTHLGFAFVADPQWRVFAGTRELQPVAADATTRVYSCKPCGGGALRIEIRSPSPGLTDIAVF